MSAEEAYFLVHILTFGNDIKVSINSSTHQSKYTFLKATIITIIFKKKRKRESHKLPTTT
jgi:hypothetical protein